MRKSAILLSSLSAFFGSHLTAAVLVTYVPTGAAPSSPNNAPINASSNHPSVSASVIGDIGTGNSTYQLGSGGTGPLRENLGVTTWVFSGDGAWLTANAQNDESHGNANSTANYFSFSLGTPGTETLTLSTLSFDYGVGSNTEGQGGTFYYAVFASVNGGAYNQIGSTFSTGNLSLTMGVTHSLGNQSIDLSSISGADTVDFRVWVGSTNGLGGVASIFRNIAVEGTVIPEPAGAMLGGVGVLLMLMRRRRGA